MRCRPMELSERALGALHLASLAGHVKWDGEVAPILQLHEATHLEDLASALENTPYEVLSRF